jgi:hypothetical protein
MLIKYWTQTRMISADNGTSIFVEQNDRSEIIKNYILFSSFSLLSFLSSSYPFPHLFPSPSCSFILSPFVFFSVLLPLLSSSSPFFLFSSLCLLPVFLLLLLSSALPSSFHSCFLLSFILPFRLFPHFFFPAFSSTPFFFLS